MLWRHPKRSLRHAPEPDWYALRAVTNAFAGGLAVRSRWLAPLPRPLPRCGASAAALRSTECASACLCTALQAPSSSEESVPATAAPDGPSAVLEGLAAALLLSAHTHVTCHVL